MRQGMAPRNTAAGRPARAALVGAGVALALALGWSAAPAFAHNYPVAYSPAEGSVVAEQPGTIAVTTNDALLDLAGAGTGAVMRVSGPQGAAKPLYFGDGCVTLDGSTAATKAQLGAPGEYTVAWQVVSTDGHPVSGEYSFTWQPAAGQTLATGSTAVPDCGGKAAAEKPAADPAAAGGTVDPGLANVAWIVGAIGAVLVAVVATLLIVTRRKPAGAPVDPVAPSTPVDPADPDPPTEQ